MELKSLEIKNIASIGSAVIDFCRTPLKEESVFLICGETGAGKSTILDAVCLALYNQAPRLASSGLERIGDDAVPADKRNPDGDLGTNDPRQFLRKGTAEASVKLVFTGLDNIDYTAVWSVRRAYGSTAGKIQDVIWTLECGEGDILHKRSEVKARIEQVTGMTFDQYCRTSMLAQGEFARFLKSSENEKADILEKLTRTDIFARIGAGIAARSKQYREAYLRQQEKISGIVLLDEEERRALQEELALKETTLNGLSRDKESSSSKLNWLQTLADLESKVEKSRIDVGAAMAALSSDSFLRNERLCMDWDLTPDQRAALSRKKEQESALERLSVESEGNRKTFMSLSADLAAREAELAENSARFRSLNEKLEMLRPYAPMYSSFKSINGLLGTVVSCRKTIGDLDCRLKKAEDTLKKAGEDYSAQADSLENMRQTRNSMQKELEAMYSAISAMDKEGKTRARNDLDDRMSLVKEAGMSVREMLKASDRKSKETAMLQSYTKLYNEACKAAGAALESFVLADRRYAEASAMVDRMRDSVDTWAKVARSKLNTGDICPLCGQEILSLTSDAEFESMLAPLKEDLEKKSEERKSAEAVMNDTAADARAWEKAVRTEQETLETVENEYAAARKEAEARCAVIFFSPDESDTLERLRDYYKAMEDERKSLGKILDDIAASEKAAKCLQDEINSRNKSIESKVAEMHAAAENIASLEKETASLQAGMDSALGNAEASMSLAGKDIVIENWEKKFNADPDRFMASLRTESEQYSSDKDELSSLAASIEKKKGIIEDIKASRQNILGIYPEWGNAGGTGPAVQEDAGWDDIHRKWVDLYSKVTSINGLEKSAEDSLQRIKAFLEKSYAANSISGERLEELLAIRPDEIIKVKEAVSSCKSALKSAESVLKQREEDLARHRLSAPEMAEEDTPERLEAYLEEIGTGLNAVNQEIGSIKQRLLADDGNSRMAGKEKEAAEYLRKKVEKWDRLYSLFGDAEGRKFRKIAQGFVMTELTRNANAYLEHLSGRYILDSQPGSLTLTVRDMYQGGAVRSVNTLSGGETFLVSLSLALGLSSLSGSSLKVNILFIDEGFGTLSSDYLNVVMESLENLHQMGGRKVGIISHVESLRERIPVQIQVRRQGSDCSSVEVVSV